MLTAYHDDDIDDGDTQDDDVNDDHYDENKQNTGECGAGQKSENRPLPLKTFDKNCPLWFSIKNDKQM